MIKVKMKRQQTRWDECQGGAWGTAADSGLAQLTDQEITKSLTHHRDQRAEPEKPSTAQDFSTFCSRRKYRRKPYMALAKDFLNTVTKVTIWEEKRKEKLESAISALQKPLPRKFKRSDRPENISVDLKSDKGLPLNTCEGFSQIQQENQEAVRNQMGRDSGIAQGGFTVNNTKGRGDEHLD